MTRGIDVVAQDETMTMDEEKRHKKETDFFGSNVFSTLERVKKISVLKIMRGKDDAATQNMQISKLSFGTWKLLQK